MRAVVFANGILTSPEEIISLLDPADRIIAADGGALHCRLLGLIPAEIVGDLDSLDPEVLGYFKGRGSRIHRHPADKDQTDLELALMLAVAGGAEEILVLGGLGGRWDMTAASIMLLLSPMLAQTRVRLIDGACEFRLLDGGSTHVVAGRKGDLLSLLPIAGDVHGIRLQGLAYTLADESLSLGSTRGISNIIRRPPAKISLRSGRLLSILTRRHSADKNR